MLFFVHLDTNHRSERQRYESRSDVLVHRSSRAVVGRRCLAVVSDNRCVALVTPVPSSQTNSPVSASEGIFSRCGNHSWEYPGMARRGIVAHATCGLLFGRFMETCDTTHADSLCSYPVLGRSGAELLFVSQSMYTVHTVRVVWHYVRTMYERQ